MKPVASKTHLKLNLQYRREVDERDLHRDCIRIQLRRRMEIAAEAIVEVISLVRHDNWKYRKDVFRIVR